MFDEQVYKDVNPNINVITLPLKDGTQFELQGTDIAMWYNIYTLIDIDYEFKKMTGWLMSNKSKRKTRGGMNRFVNGWLTKANDRAKRDEKPKAQSTIERLSDRSWANGL